MKRILFYVSSFISTTIVSVLAQRFITHANWNKALLIGSLLAILSCLIIDTPLIYFEIKSRRIAS